MDQVIVSCIYNPFQPWTSRQVRESKAGNSIAQYVRDFFPEPPQGFDLAITLNGQPVAPADFNRILIPRDSLALIPIPAGGGGDGGKNPFQTVGMLALMVAGQAWVSPMAANAFLSATAGGAMLGTSVAATNVMAATIGFMASTAFSMVGGALLNAVLPSGSPDIGSGSSSDLSTTPTYSWDIEPNTTAEAGACPVLYGTHLVQPPIIGRYTSTDGDKQFLNLLLLAADHAVDSISGVLINDQSIDYFDEIEVESRLGSLDQSVIENFGDTYTDTAIGFQLDTDWSQARGVGNVTEGLAVGLGLPYGLYYAADSGGLDAQTVAVEMQYRLADSAEWVEWTTETITEASQSPLKRYVRIDSLAAGQYEIRARLTSAPPTGARYRNTVNWEYIQEIVYDDFIYPGASLCSVKALATDQLSGGMPTVKMVVTRSTVQVWDPDLETYVSKAATNPAWACYDLLHNSIYGGGIEYTFLDFDAFSDWADWCDDQGYTCNIYVESFASLSKMLATISVLGRGVVIQVGSEFSCLIDRPEPVPTQRFMFNVANMVRNSFEITYLDMDERANAVELTYFDADLSYSRQTIFLQAENFDTTEMEINKSTKTLIGCTSRTQAIAYGQFMLNCNRYLTRVVSWTAAADSLACAPGDVIDVQHDVPQWGDGGRVVSATANTITLDRTVTLEPGTSYAIQVKLEDDTRLDEVPVQGVDVETVTDTLTITEPWSGDTPTLHNLWNFGEVGFTSLPLRIVSITDGQDLQRKITALEYVPEVYEDGATIPESETFPSSRGVTGLDLNEVWALGPDGSGRSIINASWRGTATAWNVFLKISGGSWERVGSTLLPKYTIEQPLVVGSTYFVGISVNDSPDSGEATSITISGKEGPPNDVENFSAAQVGDQLIIVWDHIPDVDLWGYEIRRGSSWATGTVIVEGVQENRATWNPPLDGTYTLWIKAIDESGNYSSNAVSYTITVDIEAGLNIVLDQDEFSLSPIFDGASNANLTYNSGAGFLEFDGTPGDVYYTSQIYDFGALTPASLRMFNSNAATLVSNLTTDEQIPLRLDTTFSSDVDDSITSEAYVLQYYRYSTDNITWTDWLLYGGVADFSTRYYQLKWAPVIATSLYDYTDFSFSSLRHIVDVPEQEKVLTDQDIADSGTVFTLGDYDLEFVSQFYIGVSVQGTTPRYWSVDKDGLTGFTVYLFDSGGAGVAGTVDIVIRGY